MFQILFHQSMGTLPYLNLLGGCYFVATDGEKSEIKGSRRELLVAIAALTERRPNDDQIAEMLGAGSPQRPSTGGVRTLRHRLPAAVRAHLGSGANRWRFEGVDVDFIRLREEALGLRRAGFAADGSALREALEEAAMPLLPRIAIEDEGAQWLIGQRRALADLRIELLETAIAWADHQADPWADHLRATLREIEPSRVTPRPVVRRARWSSPAEEVTNFVRTDRVNLIGRGHELGLLRKQFDAGVMSQVIYGEAGIGKSALASAYVERHASDYRVRWILNAESSVELRAGLRRLGVKLGIPGAEASSVFGKRGEKGSQQFLADLGDYLGSGYGSPWLLVLDNVVRPEALEELWSHLPDNGHVLITSQWPDWAITGVRGMHLWGLELNYAMTLVADSSGRVPKGDDLADICRFLNFHPLLLRHAGRTMEIDGIGATEYLSFLQTRSEEAIRKWPELDLPRRHATSTYGLAIERATKEAPGAGQLIEIASFFAPDLIGEEILHQGIVGHASALQAEDDLTRARRALRNRSLIQEYQRTESFSLHRVMQAVVRLRLDRDQLLERLGTATGALIRALPDQNAEDAHERRRWLAPHIEAIMAHVEEYRVDELKPEAAELASQLGMFRRSQSEWRAAEEAHERAVELSRDERHAGAAMRGVRLANVMRQRGHFEEAELVLATALPRLRETVPDDDVDLAYALTVQARILRARPKSSPVEASPYLDEALEILRGRQGSGSDEQLSRTLNYQAVLLRQLGEFDRAQAQTRTGFRLLVEAEPEEWIEGGGRVGRGSRTSRLLAIHLRTLGNLWRQLGRFREARTAHEKALAIIADLFDDDHSDVGRCLDSLGRVQREYGDFQEALASFTRAREISDYRFGEKYPHAATALTNISLTLREMDRLEEAAAAADEAISIFRYVYGDDWDEGTGELHNEHTAWAVFVRADLRTRQAARVADERERGMELALAERDHRQILRLRKAMYGREDHPILASSLQALADIAALRDERAAAVAMHRHAREIRVQAFGENSYWVAHSDARLGVLLNSAEERLAKLQAAEQIWKTQLAASHPWLRRLRREIEQQQQ
jgi:tetratricopeptide (TPR) repeat protein